MLWADTKACIALCLGVLMKTALYFQGLGRLAHATAATPSPWSDRALTGDFADPAGVEG